jgi:hypothetical protein
MRPIPEHVKFFLAGAATVLVPVSFLLLCFAALEVSLRYAFGGSGGETEVFLVKPSPDGVRVATLSRNMGGGAAGWCFRFIDVQTAVENEVDTQKHVFRTNCQSDIEFAWENDAVLRITYEDDRTISSLLQRKFSRDGVVRVVYSGR